MALHYLIDGYNLLYALPELPAGTLQQKRAVLLEKIARESPHGVNAVTVVFDSRQGLGDHAAFGDIRIVFTAGQTADDWISDKVRQVGNPRTVVVVTDDKGLRGMIGGTGARWLAAADFLKGHRTARPERAETPLELTEITEDLKKRWL